MSSSKIIANSEKKYKKKNKFYEVWKRYKKNKAAMVGLIIICILVLIAIFANVIADYDTMAIEQHSKDRLQGPSKDHWFGTDAYGRDVFSRIVHGSRISLFIGIASTFFCLLIGGLLGALAGYYGGMLDSIIMRVLDTIMSIPPILLSLSVVAALGAGMRNLMIAVTISRIPSFTRLIRASVLTVVGEEYIEAAKSCGTREHRIILVHILPNAIGPIIVQATMTVAQTILTAAGLSFIGMGIQPPAPEWGSMLSEAREYMRYAPYLTIFPGLAIIISALSLNLIGDGLRDALDPKLKN